MAGGFSMVQLLLLAQLAEVLCFFRPRNAINEFLCSLFFRWVETFHKMALNGLSLDYRRMRDDKADDGPKSEVSL